jgi:hypothetical protein
MRIDLRAFAANLIGLAGLACLAGCIPNYYTREDGGKMSASEREAVCIKMRAASDDKRCYYQTNFNVRNICLEAARNASDSFHALDCGPVLARVDEEQRRQNLNSLAPIFEAERKRRDEENRKKEAVRSKVGEEMRLPSSAVTVFAFRRWAETPIGEAGDVTGTEWRARDLDERPTAFRFLPGGKLVVSRYAPQLKRLTVYEPSEYGPPQEGRWIQRGDHLYVYYKVRTTTRLPTLGVINDVLHIHLYGIIQKSKYLWLDGGRLRDGADPDSALYISTWQYVLAN